MLLGLHHCVVLCVCVFVQVSEVPALVWRKNLKVKEFLMTEI